MPADDLIENLICPDCREKIVATNANRLICTGCAREFCLDRGFIQMLPTRIKRNFEDDAWKKLSYEGMNKPAWMALLHKKDRLLYFFERILPYLDFSGKVLEIGAGTCWASALIKKKQSSNLVVATDISPYALQKGLSVARLLESTPDYRIVCDAESLPFSNGYFDSALSNATIHHFQDPRKGLSEMWRVLRAAGKCYALGELAAGAPFKSILTSRIGSAGRRANSLEITEKVYSLKEWKRFFTACGFESITINFDKTWHYKLYDWFTASYYRFLSTVPNVFIGNFLPCNVDIFAAKC